MWNVVLYCVFSVNVLVSCIEIPRCEDEYLLCPRFARMGWCEGIFDKFRNASFVRGSLAVKTLSVCRESCRNEYQSKAVPEIIRELGGLEDEVMDAVGLPFPLCDLSKGMNWMARISFFNIRDQALGHDGQNSNIRRFHSVGFVKSEFPKDLLRKMIRDRDLQLRNDDFYSEKCSIGVQQCQRLEEDENECVIKREDKYLSIPIRESLRKEIESVLRQPAETFAKVELKLSTIFGIRRYLNGSWFGAHTDKFKSHIISFIVNVDQKVQEPWPLEILNHDGKLHRIFLEPGEMLFYESSTLPHGRVTPLKGEYYDNFFVHYTPVRRSDLYRKLDVNPRLKGSFTRT